MRLKTLRQQYLSFEFPSSSSKEVRRYREEYAELNRIFLDMPEVLELAHADFARWLSSSDRGRESRFTSEEILRVLVVMFVEGVDYREAVVRIENSDFLRRFIGLGWAKEMMDYSFAAKAFAALSDDTWMAMNKALGQYGQACEKLDGEALRTDTTAVETNVHYPTDSSLLWDSFRVLARVLRRVRQECPWLGLTQRYHDKKAKKLAQFIARNAGSSSKRTQQKVRTAYATLIERVQRLVDVSKLVRDLLGRSCAWYAPELSQYEPLAERVIDQARRRVFEGEVVPACEKVYSIFEPHTELIKRGKAGKPVEFGHKVVLSQTRSKFISHWRVLDAHEEDNHLVDEVLDAHESMFGHLPSVFAADKGFYQSTEQLKELRERIDVVALAKKGRRTKEEAAYEKSSEFQDGHRFRAGVEGSISVLKRAFKMRRCLYKGFKNFTAAVGCAVFCHNLMVLARS